MFQRILYYSLVCYLFIGGACELSIQKSKNSIFSKDSTFTQYFNFFTKEWSWIAQFHTTFSTLNRWYWYFPCKTWWIITSRNGRFAYLLSLTELIIKRFEVFEVRVMSYPVLLGWKVWNGEFSRLSIDIDRLFFIFTRFSEARNCAERQYRFWKLPWFRKFF